MKPISCPGCLYSSHPHFENCPDHVQGELKLPKLDGYEVRPGISLIGEPTPVPGTDKLRCLANVLGSLCVVELSIKFKEVVKS